MAAARRAEVCLTFLGGASGIGASAALLEVGETTLLIDCGVRFRGSNPLPDLDRLTGRRLDAILVTHAHSDHTGGLPVVHQAFAGVPVYMTPPTLDLVRILQKDALKLMAIATEQEGELPLYSEEQVEGMLAACVPVHHGHTVQVGEVEATFLPASHILGASMLHLATPGGNVLFTGDYSVEAQRTVPGLDRPALPVDLVVSEATYGDRLHADRRVAERMLVERVAATLTAGGQVLIPVFAIGRAQEVLLILKAALRHGKLPEVPVLVDGMVRPVCNVYSRHEGYVSRALQRAIRSGRHPFFEEPIRAVSGPEDRRRLLQAGPAVFVASSGMLAGGASTFYAAALAPHERNAIFITGYQDEESPGRALTALVERPAAERTLRLGGEDVPVRASYDSYRLSAHADRTQMFGFIRALGPRSVVLVHGDRPARESLAGALGARDVHVAEDGHEVRRSYRGRRTSASESPAGRAAAALPADAATVAALLGPPGRQPLRLEHLVQAWFGRKVGGALRERFARALEATGLVRRDDRRRSTLWHTRDPAAGEGSTAGDTALAESLKQENPKGKLLELCMRRRWQAPVPLEAPAGQAPGVALRLEVDDQCLETEFFRAETRKLAEQLAARALLEMLSAADDEPAVAVDEDEAVRLKRENPKGRLLEACARARLAPPELEVRPVAGGFHGRGSLELPDGTRRQSGRYLAQQARTTEQAVAGDLLAGLQGSDPRPSGARTPAVSRAAGAAPDPRVELNELRQRGLLTDYGFELVEQRVGSPGTELEFAL